MTSRPRIQDILPLSPFQEGLLFHSLYDASDASSADVYTVQWSFDLAGPLDAEALRGAAEAMLRRHPNLRAAFRQSKSGEPVQIVPTAVPLPWREVDLSAESRETADAESDHILLEDRARRFNPARPPLLRFTLIRFSADRHRLVLMNHHLLLDGWSMPLFMQELFTYYAKGSDFAGLPHVTPYRDYLSWLGQQDQDTARKAWGEALAGLDGPTRVAAAASHQVTVFPERAEVVLSAEETLTLEQSVRQSGLTLNSAIQGAWGAVLSQLTGRADVTFGATVSGRSPELRGAETMVGLFINTVPVRIRIDPAASLRTSLSRLQDDQAQLMEHQHLGLSDIHRASGRSELFDTCIVFENYPLDSALFDLSDAGLRITAVQCKDAAHYPLRLVVVPGERLRLWLDYRPDLFDQASAARILAQLARVLEAVVATPELPVGRVEITGADERLQVLETWNDTSRPVPDATLSGLFEAQAAENPDAIAVTFEGEEVSYGELNAHANQLARHLAAQGAGPERRVAVALPRSVELVTALLAVLKCGAAYIPVDPDYPADRIAYMLQDADPTVVLTTDAVRAALPGNASDSDDIPYIALDQVSLDHLADTDLIDGERTAPLTADSPAYVIYTSGSTGRPKGVVVSHSGIVNRLLWMQDQYGLAADDRVLQKTPSGFDVSVWEFFWPLITGAVLVVARPEGHKDPAYLATLIQEQRVTTAHFVPSMLQVFLQEPAAARCTGLRRVICSGEALPAELAQRFLTTLDVPLHNLYGPTEASVDVTSWECHRDNQAASVPIGRPVWNTRLYVLDAALRPVPEGVTGELYIAGAQLARGYLNRHALTAERFVADPYGKPGTRMYRTGDLARWRADGALEYAGRTDDQVKLRGFRIELGEIESVLAERAEVAQVAVIVREDRPGDHRLTAYVVGRGAGTRGAGTPGAGTPDAGTPDADALRAHLQQRVPEFMVPAAFMVLDALPLTPNGKLDRKALPAPELTTDGTGRTPRTPQEQKLCTVFAEVLGLPEITIDDSFFDLGGHSLLATRLISRIRSTLDLELDIRALFETPTVAGLSERLNHGNSKRPALHPATRPAQTPLSFAQQRLWFLGQLEGPSATYNIPLVVRLTGALDIDALRAAFGDVVTRHESLRTLFPEVDGQPHQHVLDTHAFGDAEHGQLLTIAESSPETLDADIAAASRHAFDLTTELPVHAWLFSQTNDQHVLVAVVHHIAGDGWSMGPLARDVATAYTARLENEAPQWTQLPVQYADYTLWQRETLGGEDDATSLISAQLDYWKTALADLPDQLELPTDRPRPAVASHRGDTIPLTLSPELHHRLTTLAQARQASLFMVIQAGLTALLTRLGAGTDIPIGTPIAGRTDEALDDLIGFFVNTLVLRTNTADNPTFDELVDRVRETDLAAFSHQDLPFERLVEVLNPARSMARHPLFQVMLAFQNAPASDLTMPGLTTTVDPIDAGAAKFDLSLSLSELFTADGTAQGITGTLEYATDLFDHKTAEQITERLIRLLEAVTADPQLPIGQAEILTPDERQQVLIEWNDTSRPVPEDTLPSLFQAQVARTPHAIAAVFDSEEITYRELNDRANRLARLLVKQGAGPERLVAVALPRSLDLIVALLAVLKSGAAYVPIDPGHPADRIAYMLQDAMPTVVLTTDAVRATLPGNDGIPHIALNQVSLGHLADTDLTDGERTAPLTADTPAYVIYTSGSTGRPKGVVVPHRALTNFLTSMQERFQLDENDRLLAVTTVAFDIAALELYLPLLTGARTILASHKAVQDPQALRALAHATGATTLQATPSLWHALTTDTSHSLTGIRALVGGEALPTDLARTLTARTASVTNLYGPTETTIWSTAHPLHIAPDTSPAIGRPIANTQVYVLDAALRPVPAGVAGELYIAGNGLARGYLNRRSLTAERFVADPYGEPGARMYRTGDLARWRADGTLEYLARADDQVKLRGFRIELGEIESVLAEHPDVAQATVIVREDRPGDQRLTAYIVGTDAGTPDTAALRAHLQQRVPDYMIPAAFVALDALPLTPNGKLDRKVLPAPDLTADSTGRAPRTPQEQKLCTVFAEVLGLPEITIDDSFFDLGGHSLLATRLISRIRSTLDLELDIRALFETPTVAGLSERLNHGNSKRPALHPATRPAQTPLSFAQQRLWFLGQLEGPSATYNIPLVVRLTGALDIDALRAAFGDVVARHESLRTLFPEVDGQPYQLVLAPDQARPELTIADSTPDTLDADIAAASRHAFDLTTELPVRAWLFSQTNDQHVLVAIVHHIAGDGWSMGPLARDVATAYTARSKDQTPDWVELPVQYADYTLWQRETLGGEDDATSLISGQLDYWKTALADLPDQLELPTDRPRPAIASHHGDTIPLTLSPELHHRLTTLAQARQASLFMVIQAGLTALLTRLGAGTDIPIGTPIAGRTDEALDDLIGFFVNTLVLRTNTADNPTFDELVDRVRETDLAAFSHQDLPFERLVEVLNPARSMARHPLFQVMLAFQNAPASDLTMPGLTTTVDPIDAGAAKFDLSLSLSEIFTADGTAQGITGTLEYATDLFDHKTAAHIAERLIRLLEAVTADPQLPIAQAEILTPDERQQVLEGWNDTDRPLPDATFPALFEAQAAKTPDAIAVALEGGELTYADLNTRANQLARLLIQQGAGPDRFIAVALPRSADLVTALLAVLKSGAAYMPVDPGYPADRIAYMLQDASPAAFLTTQLLAATLPDQEQSTPRILLDQVSHKHLSGADLAEGERTAPLTADTPAYVIYTSGSTGRPKGVVVPHRGLANQAQWTQAEFGVGTGDVMLARTSIGFDVSLWEICHPLAAGAAVCPAPDEATHDLRDLLDYAEQHQVTLASFVPSLLTTLPTDLGPGSLRQVFSGAEALPTALAHRITAQWNLPLANLYGPSETTIQTTAHHSGIESGSDQAATAPIGHPVWNTRTYVLDANLRPVPAGVTGELYITGTQLAHGYLNRPDLTAERFIANPYGEPGERMYRTGDLARRRTDGALEYAGRTDDQVKLRGFRIELGEIESALAQHPDVAQAAVIVREDRPGDQRLTAYVVGTDGAEPNAAALRAHLQQRVPDYMIPAAFITLDALPLTPNGKLDRKALPAPDISATSTGRAPRTPQEETLCTVFAEVLGLPEVTIDDNFFDLGGHSLLATRLISRIRSTLNAELDIRALFETPTVAGLAERLDGDTATRSALRPAIRPERIPLSFAQQRLWFLGQLEGPSPTYNIPLVVRLTGALDVEALRAAFGDVVARHESLRTLFPQADGHPHQLVLAPDQARPELTIADSTPDTLDADIAAASRHAFDLTTELPVRAWLFSQTNDQHVLVAIVHHIAGDGWSMGPLARDVAAAYTARLENEAPQWTQLPVQYADYTLWQRETLGGEDDATSLISGQLDYWKTALADLPDQLELPTDRPRPAIASHHGDTIPLTLSPELHHRLTTLAQARQASLFMVIQAGLTALLTRLGAGTDIPIGTPIAGRTDEALDDLIGFFVNTLVLRTNTADNPTFDELVDRVRETDLAAFSHQDLPFERLVEVLNPARSMARHPLFQVMLAFQNAPASDLTMPGLTTTVDPIDAGAAKFDLSLSLSEIFTADGTAQGITGTLEYATDLFDHKTAAHIAERLIRLLEAVTADPQLPIAQAEILTPDERQQVLEGWNDTDRPLPDATFPALFEAQAAKTPDAIAVALEGGELTYADLNTRANQLARLLIQQGAGADRFIAVALPRSADLVTALLAVLKSGAAYMPVDPGYPADRIAYMLQDASPAAFLTTQLLAATLPDQEQSTPRILLDQVSHKHLSGADLAEGERTAPLTADTPAYVIYTSGSTGRPKGVVVPHRGLANQAQWTQAEFGVGTGDVMLARTSIGFDVSLWEICHPLAAGAAVCPAPDEATHDLRDLLDYAEQHQVTLASFVPSLLTTLPTDLGPGSLRQVFSGAEALPTALAHRITAQWNLPLANLYGPSETTIQTTAHHSGIESGSDQAATAPIGHPVWNTRTYVLDANLRPVPAGVTGELYITGTQLAHGYLNRPDLTAERFIANPYGEPGERMYRTGDLARRRTDGALEYAGRTDDQVKLRGFRIELGEIESALAQHPDVAQAAVIVREDRPGDQRLTAYVVGTDGAEPNAAALRAHLQQRVPDYMIPAAFITLDALPLTPNGKLDRKALPAPDISATSTGRAPRTPQEETLCTVFAEVLGLPEVTIDDNFFELGGHSLLAVTLVERLRAQGLPIEVRALFTSPTVAALATTIGRENITIPANLIPANATTITPEMLPLADLSQGEIDKITTTIPGGTRNVADIYPLAPLQEGIFFHHLMTADGDSDVYVLPSVLGFDSRTRLDTFLTVLQTVIDRHDILRTAVLWERLREPMQVVCRQATLPVEEVTLPLDTSDPVAALLSAGSSSVDIRRAPLLRMHIAAEPGSDRWLALLQIHHLAQDHTALDVLLDEVRTLLNGHDDRLPEPLPYRNFVAQARLRIPREEHEEFFADLLGDVTEPTAPYGLLNVHGDGTTITQAEQALEPQLAARIREQARRHGVSAATLFHVTWARLTTTLATRDDVVFGTVLFGRMDAGTGSDRMPGLFINTLPVRANTHATTVANAVHTMQNQLANLLTHEHAPLALAQQASGVASQAPLFTSLLNYRHSPASDQQQNAVLDGVDFLHSQERTNYPLTISIDDTGTGFGLTVQATTPIDPQSVCTLLNATTENVVAALETAPQTPLQDVEVLAADQRHQVLEQWNGTARPTPVATLPALFEAQAAKTPDATTVTSGDQELTYAELNTRANRLARLLVQQGAGPEQLVAVAVPRSLDLMVALFAVLKSGAAYVPVDPGYPADRIAHMLRDAAPTAMLTTQETAAALPSEEHGQEHGQGQDVPRILLDQTSLDHLSGADLTDDERIAPLRITTPAYVIYTSGSTGLPKGVVVQHASVTNLLTWARTEFTAQELSRVLASTSLNFDVSVFEMFAPLVSGGSIDIVKDLLTLTDHPDHTWNGSLISAVPSAFAPILHTHTTNTRTPAADTVVLAGEALTAHAVRDIRQALPHARIANIYGPTEATVYTTAWTADTTGTTGTEADGTAPPIGRPIANARTYVLDANLQPVPTGVTGELYLAGTGLARGYLNRPDLTAERFIADPYGEPGARMYRTGDMARWRADGTLEYVARADHQVKVRGFRIELGEIESVLAEHPDVAQVAVIVREDRPGDQRLTAYIVGTDNAETVDTNGVRAHVQQRVPDYMVPAAFITLNALPLTPNGKLDRKALPTPDLTTDSTGRAPRTPQEETLCTVFAEVLGLPEVTIDDNFFELGGHSLLAVTLVERLRAQGLPIEVRALFTSPTVAALATTIGRENITIPANLIPANATTITPEMLPLADLSQGEIDKITTTIPGGTRNVADIYPLAPLQEGIFFHHLMTADGDSDVYVLPSVLGFDSRTRLDTFLTVLQTVIDRHDILRTAVLWEGLREPMQVVCRRADIPVEEVTLKPGDLDAASQLMAAGAPSMDIRRAPLLRMHIAAEPGSDRWLALLQIHHLAQDHTALDVLLDEVRTLLNGHDNQLPEPLPYRNFVAQARLRIPREEHEEFFADLLGDVTEPTAPYGLLNVHGDGTTITQAEQALEPQLAARIREQARRHGVSAATLFHVTWARLTTTLATRDDVVFGTVLFGRMDAGTGSDRMPGLFINTLPVRANTHATTVANAVHTMQNQLANLLTHEHAPLALAQQASNIPAQAPLFTSLLNYRHTTTPAPQQDTPLEGIDLLHSQERTNYPLTISIDDTGTGFGLTVQATTPIDPATLCVLLQTTAQNLVTALEAAPDTPLQEIEILRSGEQRQLLETWNNTAQHVPDATLPDLIQAQTARTPDATAVAFEGQELTYTDLNSRANQLARQLVAQGAGPEKFVAVALPRSLDLVVALLAVLKSGAAYVPVDLSYPADRIAYMLEDATPAAVLTTREIAATRPAQGVPCIVVNQADQAHQGDLNDPTEADPTDTDLTDAERTAPLTADSPAYVIYTSGSTGRPKGVVVPHSGIVNRLLWMQDQYGLATDDRVLQKTPSGFDVSVWEFFWPLITGAVLVVARPEGHKDPAYLATLIQEQRVTTAHFVPSMLQVFLQEPAAARCTGLRRVICSGEALPAELAQRFLTTLDVPLHNLYGPTEASVDVTSWECHRDNQAASVPIGRPVWNTRLYVLDSALRPVPEGVTGELYIAGAQLARGYLNRHGLTAERFIADPYGQPGTRMYRTGDLARWRADGALEYLARADHQVKIRGFRIELGEIESVLTQHDAVAQAAVIVREDRPGDQRLTAYLVGTDNTDGTTTDGTDGTNGTSPDATALRAHLHRRVPEYMVPAAFMVLDALPLTPNGKLDRKALPAPDISTTRTGRAPRTPQEQELCAVFAEVLGLPQVTVDDNFFELGGHSLLATRLISRVRSALDAELDIRALYEAPTVAGLAERLGSAKKARPALRRMARPTSEENA
ncbi:non-ribosomal peptide synthetase [Streptomyces halobius]|uniref:Non-ribosomal peptide synthase/polyketide synthase n=1 Tax=Streptomyces halobius TaxID=2879846 RepID=A0ABY4M889_9ACTN|nr:non-ribosomal peptide synthase/polyketide synthase [Streptomyces halobius]UQA92486.1 non-ribosomal peptide synthase/polyketide synthase [Streptomyces halobius]